MSVCMSCVPHGCLRLRRAEESVRCPGIGGPDYFKLSCRYWELNLGSLEDQSVFLTIEPPLHPLIIFIYTTVNMLQSIPVPYIARNNLMPWFNSSRFFKSFSLNF